MMIVIPKNNELIRNIQIEDIVIRAPEGTIGPIDLFVPTDSEGVKQIWTLLRNYTKEGYKVMADVHPDMNLDPRVEAADLDDVRNVIRYFFNPDGETPGYLLVGARERQTKKIRGMVAIEVADVSEIFDNDKRGMGFIYQVGVDKQSSKNFSDLSLATNLYAAVSPLLQIISTFDKGSWLGVVTESRKAGPELDALMKAEFEVLVPNSDYKPPRTDGREYTKDLTLLHLGVKDTDKLTAAEVFAWNSYCEPEHKRRLEQKTIPMMREYLAELI